jgi:hypothetical protein
MKKFAFLFAIAFLALRCAPTIYTAPGFERIKRDHEKVAIVPFSVEITMKKLPKDMTQQQLEDQKKSNGYSMQSEIYSQLLRQASKGRNYTVEFQDVDKTNSLLKEAGIGYEDVRTTSREKLAQILGVDAIISGNMVQEKPMSDGAALAVGLLVGYWGTTNHVTATMNIHNKGDGKLLWKYDYEASGSVGSSTQNLAEALMRKASKKFPYQKE